MNYYGSTEHMALLQGYDDRVFPQCDFSKPSDEYCPGDDFLVRCYSAVDENESTRTPYRDLNTGEVCRLYHSEELVFEWKYIGASPREATILQHANGKSYLLYYENLYGYSVLDLTSMQSVHYIPQESYETDRERFEETVIWVVPHYDPESSLLAIEGCVWGAPYTVLVVDFNDPMRIVEAGQWLNLNGSIDSESYHEINFIEWTTDALVCDTGRYGKTELFKLIDNQKRIAGTR